MTKGKSKNWSLEDLSAHYDRLGTPIPKQTQDVLSTLGLGQHLRAPGKAPEARFSPPEATSMPAASFHQAIAELAGKKRKGVHIPKITNSLRAALVYAEATHGPSPTLSLWFDGARLLTVNELISVLRMRPKALIPYLSQCKKVVPRALSTLASPPPFFDGPTRLSLYRRGKKLVDLDSLPATFKYVTDSLRQQHLIPDDNPLIIVETKVFQEQGPYALGVRLERLVDWQPPDLTNLKQLWLPHTSVR